MGNCWQDQFRETGQAMASAQVEQLQAQFSTFKSSLEVFAHKHQKEIGRNPILRNHFQKMCSSIGVDPLTSGKGFWTQALGVGDFYYELAVQIVEACLVFQDQTGGFMDLSNLKSYISKLRGSNAVEITNEDIVRAVETLKPLGSGYNIIVISERKMIQSVPRELAKDHSKVLELGEIHGFLTQKLMLEQLGWSEGRIRASIDFLLGEGLVWLDEQATNVEYWFPCFFNES